MTKRIPVACTLGPSDAAGQLGEWQALHARVLGVDRIEGGVRLRLPGDLQATAQDLARREQNCCAFLTISVIDDDGDTVVEITSDQTEATPVIDILAGIAAED